MQRRFRFRRVLKWTGTLACLVILLAAAASLIWSYVTIANANWAAWIVGGAFALKGDAPQTALPWEVQLGPGAWPKPLRLWRSCGIWLQYESTGPIKVAVVPLWVPFLLFAVPTAWLWRVDRRRARPGHCRACGYDLTGNTSGRCSECGAATTSG